MRGEANKKEMNEASTDEEDDLDNLTLSLARKRSKNKEGSSSNKKLSSSNYDVQSADSTSDDELTLGSILKDERGEAMDVEIDIQRPNSPHSCSAHENARSTDLVEIDNSQKYDELTDSEIGALGHGDPGSGSENDATPDTSREQRGLVLDDNADNVHNGHHYSDLKDSGDDEQAPSASLEKSVMRRKLRVVMDFDDDE